MNTEKKKERYYAVSESTLREMSVLVFVKGQACVKVNHGYEPVVEIKDNSERK